MSDATDPKRRLSEISHLFLSGVRERHLNGQPQPVRRPPTKREQPAPTAPVSIDLTEEEMDRALDGVFRPAEQRERVEFDGGRTRPVTAVLAPHLEGGLLDAARQYAGHRCASGHRVGLIYVDAPGMRLFRFDPDGDGGAFDEDAIQPESESGVDARRLGEALVELDADVDQWLLVLANPAAAEARVTLAAAGRWVVLSTADHDGVLGAYRSIKSLLPAPERPPVGLALLDAASAAAADRVHQKVASACEQFLGLDLANDPPADFNANVSELAVLTCGGGDTPVTASAALWEVLYEFVENGPAAEQEAAAESGLGVPPEFSVALPAEEKAQTRAGRPSHDIPAAADDPWFGPRLAVDPKPVAPEPAAPIEPMPAAPIFSGPVAGAPQPLAADTVLDLPADASPSAVIAAVVRASPDLAAAPVAPPVLPGATVAVTREGRLTLLAAADAGADLRPIVAGLRWLSENRPLLAMAMPQFRIDGSREPQLRLYVDRANASADALRPLLRDDQVVVRTYRTLRWGGRVGLLLEAA